MSKVYKEPEWAINKTGNLPPKWGVEVIKNGIIISNIKLKKKFNIFGRCDKCDVLLEHSSISRQHLVFQHSLDYDNLYIFDWNTTQGTFLNRKRIESNKYIQLYVGDTIQIGASTREYIIIGPTEAIREEYNSKNLEEYRRRRKEKAELANLASNKNNETMKKYIYNSNNVDNMDFETDNVLDETCSSYFMTESIRSDSSNNNWRQRQRYQMKKQENENKTKSETKLLEDQLLERDTRARGNSNTTVNVNTLSYKKLNTIIDKLNREKEKLERSILYYQQKEEKEKRKQQEDVDDETMVLRKLLADERREKFLESERKMTMLVQRLDLYQQMLCSAKSTTLSQSATLYESYHKVTHKRCIIEEEVEDEAQESKKVKT